MAKLKEHWKYRRDRDEAKDEAKDERSPAGKKKVPAKKNKQAPNIKNELELADLLKQQYDPVTFAEKLLKSKNPTIIKFVATNLGMGEQPRGPDLIVTPRIYSLNISSMQAIETTGESEKSALVLETSDPPLPPNAIPKGNRSITSENLFGVLAQSLDLKYSISLDKEDADG